MHAKKIETLEYFHGMLNKQIDLVERRMIRDETIPAEEKIHSLFEPHTEWLYKGKPLTLSCQGQVKQKGRIGT